ncbi:MAG: hypothetical protein CML67_10020, partial [Rhodobacteraceae bacterium]|nr:hypothetical protein [Paracoccaceae bacterium]
NRGRTVVRGRDLRLTLGLGTGMTAIDVLSIVLTLLEGCQATWQSRVSRPLSVCAYGLRRGRRGDELLAVG